MQGYKADAPREPRSQRLLMFFCLLVLVILNSFIVWQVLSERQERLATVTRTLETLSVLLEQHTLRSLQGAELVLETVVTQLEREPLSITQSFLEAQAARLPFTGDLLVLGAAGDAQAVAVNSTALGQNFADRAYFRLPQADPAAGLYVDEPIVSRVTGERFIALSLPYSQRGLFAGVVVAVVEVTTLERFYAALTLGDTGSIRLWRSDGQLLVAVGEEGAGDSSLERTRQLEAYPLLLRVSQARREVLAPWQEHTQQLAVVGLLVNAALLLLGAFVLRQFRQLVQQAHFIHSVAEATPDLLYVYDLETQQTLYMNRQGAQTLGYRPDDLRGFGRNFLKRVLHPEDEAQLKKVAPPPEPHDGEPHDGAAHDGELQHLLSRLRHKDGHYLCFSNRTVSFSHNDKGEIKQILGLAQDVSERQAVEAQIRHYGQTLEQQNAELEAQRQQLLRLAEFRRALVEFMSRTLEERGETFYTYLLEQAVAVIPGAQAGSLLLRDEQNKYTFVAAVGYDLSALQRVSFSAKEVAMTSAERELRRVQNYSINRTLDRERDEILRKAGRSDEIKIALSVPVRLGGETVAFLNLDNFETADAFSEEAVGMVEAFAVQVGVLLGRLRLEAELQTRQREVERANVELERANRLKSEFLANMSHELRTPLTSIIGFSEVMVDGLFGSLNDKQHKYLGDINDSGRHLLALINDILDLSKIEAGKMELHLGLIDVYELLQSALTVVRERAQKGNIELSLSHPEGMSLLLADSRKLKQALFNLLSNAVKFTPSGGRVHLQAHESDTNFIFEVIDTGIGINERDQERLFIAFSQVDPSNTREYEGTGLGLALTQQLVALHRGEVWVQSREGEGSIFGLSIPKTAPAPEPDLETLSDSGKLVLIVEDDERTAQLLRVSLERAAYRVIRAENGAQALELLALAPDLILLDLLMPVVSGWDFLERLADPAHKPPPIVVVSVAEDAERAYDYGVAAVLPKPLERDALLATVAGLIGAGERLNLLVLESGGEPLAAQAQLEREGHTLLVSPPEGVAEVVQALTFDLLLVRYKPEYLPLLFELRERRTLHKLPFILLLPLELEVPKTLPNAVYALPETKLLEAGALSKLLQETSQGAL